MERGEIRKRAEDTGARLPWRSWTVGLLARKSLPPGGEIDQQHRHPPYTTDRAIPRRERLERIPAVECFNVSQVNHNL